MQVGRQLDAAIAVTIGVRPRGPIEAPGNVDKQHGGGIEFRARYRQEAAVIATAKVGRD